MSRPLHLLWVVLLLGGCDGYREVRLLEPNESTASGGTSAAGFGGGTGGRTGSFPNAGSAGATETAVALPTPKIVFKNLMIIKTDARIADQSWQLTDGQVSSISAAFRVTFPALISEFSSGDVVLDNYVTVSTDPILSLGWSDDMIEPENVPGWEAFVGPSGSYDCVYLLSARPQNSVYTRYALVNDPIVGWISDGARTDLSKYGGVMAGWMFGWLAAIGPMFYEKYLGLDHVPGINSSDEFGYARNQDGYTSFLAWYRDYMNRDVVLDGVNWGLGNRAWTLGNLRDWAKIRGSLSGP